MINYGKLMEEMNSSVKQLRESTIEYDNLMNQVMLRNFVNVDEMIHEFDVYYDHQEIINKRIERLCQLFLTNPWLIDNISESYGKMPINRIDELMTMIARNRMNNERQRISIVKTIMGVR